MFFAANNALSKILSTSKALGTPLSVHMILFYHYLSALVLLSVFTQHLTAASLQRLKAPYLHVLRGLVCLLGLTLLHSSFKQLSLLQATSFHLASPILSILMGVYLFNEKLCKRKCLAFVFSIGTYALLLNPDTLCNNCQTIDLWSLLAPACTVMCFQFNTFLTKTLTRVNEQQNNLLLTSIISVPIFLLPEIAFNGLTPSPMQCALLLTMSVNLLFALTCLNHAIALADISFLVPLVFVKQVLNAFFGCLVFSEIPTLTQTIAIGLGLLTISILSSIPERKTGIATNRQHAS